MSHKFGRFSDPRDPKRPQRISLAYGDWQDIPTRIIQKYGDLITELDLSYNNFLYPLEIRNIFALFGFIFDYKKYN